MKERLNAVIEALSILRLSGYTLNNDAYCALVKERGKLEDEILRLKDKHEQAIEDSPGCGTEKDINWD